MASKKEQKKVLRMPQDIMQEIEGLQGVNLAAEEFKQYDELPPIELIRKMNELRSQIDALEAQLKPLNRHHNFLRMIKIPAKFDDEGVSLIRVDGVGRCNLTTDLFARVDSTRTEEAYQWLRDTGHGDVIKPSIHPSTFKALCKAMLVNGEEYPDTFRIVPYSKAVITKGG